MKMKLIHVEATGDEACGVALNLLRALLESVDEPKQSVPKKVPRRQVKAQE